MTLHVPSFGGGVVLTGAAGQRRIDELLVADGLDIGPRGALICTADRSDYVRFVDDTAVPWSAIHAVLSLAGVNFARLVAIGEGNAGTPTYIMNVFDRVGDASPIPWAPDGTAFQEFSAPFAAVPLVAEGIVVTAATFPGVFNVDVGAGTVPVNVFMVNLGAREGFAPRTAPGLYAVIVFPPAITPAPYAVGLFEALGTGLFSADFPTGTQAQQLFPRGVIAYNNHVFVWGFDAADATTGDGPNRVMFSNLGLPLKYGNDNQGAVGTDRAFTDTDAITLGDAGEIIRGAIKWAGRLWFGTNQQLHYIAGYGRDSFLTDGATPVAKAFNIVGAHGLIEGPDRKLYGMSDQGLWGTADGENYVPHFQKLVDFDGRSVGYWDCIWTDETRPPDPVPGITNQDLVWMANDWDRRQVVIGIPWCDAIAGYGYGLDTVVIKFHVDTGGFTRQVFLERQLTAAAYLRREGQQPAVRLLAEWPDRASYYGFSASPTTSPAVPSRLPLASFGPYAPFGPDGRGSLKRLYLTVAWETAASLPLTFHITTTVDQATSDDFLLTLANAAPAGPASGDLWLDTSLVNNNLGNSLAGTITPAFPAALLNQWTGTAWRQLTGVGSNGQRAVIRLPLLPRNGTWWTATADCTAAAGRFQLEALGEKPAGGSQAE